jgi:hypothetical protein
MRLLVMTGRTMCRLVGVLLASLSATTALAGVLAEDRADIMFHRYSGGGVTIQGPSVLVRKKFGENFAATANYYVDNITSASIDVVVSGASQYKEHREQKSLSAEYMRGKSTYSLSYTLSEENDYKAQTGSISISQDMFGDLTTVSIGYSQGLDKIGSSIDPAFAREVDRRNYRVGVSQVLTRNMLLSLNFETTTEEGYLQNPYRFMRFVGPPGSYTKAPETFPATRTGNAGSARLKYYLPWHASASVQYRFYTDTWGINAHTAGIEYTQPVTWSPLKGLTLTGSYRYYMQNSADFFSDLFPRDQYQNFMARDKETSALTTHTMGVLASYQFPVAWARYLAKGTANFQYNRMMVFYDEFRDLRNFPPGTAEPGTEPLYELNANIFQLYLSLWF